jgi:Mg2+ and Co2+ transporter CorA
MLVTNKLIHATSDATHQTNQLIRQNGETISQLASSSFSETKAIARLTEDSQRDARSVKILTFVAMLYLPASLVAVMLNKPRNLSMY